MSSRAAAFRSLSSPGSSHFNKVSLRLDPESLDEATQEEDYFPAGSMSSHRDSRSESDEDSSHPAPSIQPKLSPDASGFQPTSDNVIVFEVYTPTEEECGAKDFRFSTTERDCYVISEEVSDSRGFGSSPDLLGSENSGYSGDEDDGEKAETSSRAGLLPEIMKLQQTISQLKGENRALKMLLKERDAALAEMHSAGAERSDRSTMTAPVEDGKTLKMEQLSNACRRYERQNQELRREIQSCTSDLVELDKARTKLANDMKRAETLVETYEGEFFKLCEYVDKLLQHSDDELFWTQPERDPRHLSNYLFSKLEILGSRYSRQQAAHDSLVEDHSRLRQELESRLKQSQAQSADHSDLVKQLNTRIKLKDRFIQKLENTLKVYKEKLMEMRDEDLRRSLEGESIEMMAPCNRTENLSNKLKSLVEDLKPFHSHDGSPLHMSAPSSLVTSSPQRFPSSKPKVHTEKSFLESDEDVFRPAYLSGSESLNNTMDCAPRKPDTPIVTKRWKVKQEKRNLHHRTQSQNMFALENYQPVLMNRTLGKEISFRGPKGPIITTTRQDLSQTRTIRSETLALKQCKPPKSLSLDRKRTGKDASRDSDLPRGKSSAHGSTMK